MIIWLANFFFFNFFIFVEMIPRHSISQDLSIIKRCNASFPTDKTTLNTALIEKQFEDDVEYNFKCFLHCLYDSYGWMTHAGDFRGLEMRTILEESSLDEPSIEYLVDTCTEIDAEDRCERAYLFTECFWMESEKLV